MSRRYSNRRWWDAPVLAAQLYSCKQRLHTADTTCTALQADRVRLAEEVADATGANAALITEVNGLRAALHTVGERLADQAAQLATCRCITTTQARIISTQGDELVRTLDALAVGLGQRGTA
jgi:conjugal transfer/entry exclusion protein